MTRSRTSPANCFKDWAADQAEELIWPHLLAAAQPHPAQLPVAHRHPSEQVPHPRTSAAAWPALQARPPCTCAPAPPPGTCKSGFSESEPAACSACDPGSAEEWQQQWVLLPLCAAAWPVWQARPPCACAPSHLLQLCLDTVSRALGPSCKCNLRDCTGDVLHSLLVHSTPDQTSHTDSAAQHHSSVNSSPCDLNQAAKHCVRTRACPGIFQSRQPLMVRWLNMLGQHNHI